MAKISFNGRGVAKVGHKVYPEVFARLDEDVLRLSLGDEEVTVEDCILYANGEPMEITTGKTYKNYTDKLAGILVKKNTAYGDAFGKSIEKYGYVAALVRMSDKWNRLNNLMLNNEIDDIGESVQDTLLDLAGYCILTMVTIDETKR